MNELVPMTSDPAALLAQDAHIDEPRKELRLGMIAAGLFFVGFLGWAAFAPLDAAANAGGQLIVSGHRQTVQHRDGGVARLLAKRAEERQAVLAGQHEVEHDGVHRLAGEHGAHLAAVDGAADLQLVLLQVVGQQLADVGVVVDDQDVVGLGGAAAVHGGGILAPPPALRALSCIAV